jgi:polyhydroxyalkanoate synthase
MAKKAIRKLETPRKQSAEESSFSGDNSLYERKYAWIDQYLASMIGKFSHSLSPAALLMAYSDWILHLASMPGKQLELLEQNVKSGQKVFQDLLDQLNHQKPLNNTNPDKRFLYEGWNHFPFSFYKSVHLATEAWWEEVFSTVPGVSQHHKNVLSFKARQANNFFSPTNFIPTNPEVIETTIRQSGSNLIRGLGYWIEDQIAKSTREESESLKKYKPGRDLAITPGTVVYQNELIELLQYSPSTKKVYKDPILFVPAWIMKYYILDLSPHNSLVKFMVDQGYTVFMISWKNPTYAYRNIGFNDYINQGILTALDVIQEICGTCAIHATGYCLGGTLLSMAAALLAKTKKNPLKSITMLAAQVDFEEAGEILLFVDDSQVNFLKSIMKRQGYLDKSQLKGSFEMIRSYDLIWSYRLRRYLLGQPQKLSDISAWNSDETRLPYRMHTEYLEKLYLNNALTEGHFVINDDVLSIRDIEIPLFSVATIRDHISPWRSVYKIHLVAGTDITFVLASGGHNMGVISEPGNPKGNYQIRRADQTTPFLSPEEWEMATAHNQGSWWLAWQEWLKAQQSSPEMIDPPRLGSIKNPALHPAPGTFIFED